MFFRYIGNSSPHFIFVSGLVAARSVVQGQKGDPARYTSKAKIYGFADIFPSIGANSPELLPGGLEKVLHNQKGIVF